METRASQTDDPTNFKDTLEDLRKDLVEVVISNERIDTGARQRYDGIDGTQFKLSRLFNGISELSQSLSELQAKADVNQRRIASIDRTCEELKAEMENLQYEEKFHSTEESYQCLENKVSETERDIANSDKEAERKLRDFTRDDLTRKTDELNKLNIRVANKRLEVAAEWESFKEDVSKYREEKRHYLHDLNQLNQQTIKRLKSITKYSGSGLDQSERNAIDDTVKFLVLDMEYRDEMNKLQDCQICTLDLETEISSLLEQHNALWKRNAELQAQIHEFRVSSHGQEEAGILLRKTKKHKNLPEMDGDRDDLEESPSDNVIQQMETDRLQHFGKLLHKHTDINLDNLINYEEEIMKSLWVSTYITSPGDEIKNRDMGQEIVPEAPSEERDFTDAGIDQSQPPTTEEEKSEPPNDQTDDNSEASDDQTAAEETSEAPDDQTAVEETSEAPDDQTAAEETSEAPDDQTAVEETSEAPDDHRAVEENSEAQDDQTAAEETSEAQYDQEDENLDDNGDEDGESKDEEKESLLQNIVRQTHGAIEASAIPQDQQFSMVSKLRGRLNAGSSSSTKLPTVQHPGGITATGLSDNPLTRQSSFRASPKPTGMRKRR